VELFDPHSSRRNMVWKISENILRSKGEKPTEVVWVGD